MKTPPALPLHAQAVHYTLVAHAPGGPPRVPRRERISSVYSVSKNSISRRAFSSMPSHAMAFRMTWRGRGDHHRRGASERWSRVLSTPRLTPEGSISKPLTCTWLDGSASEQHSIIMSHRTFWTKLVGNKTTRKTGIYCQGETTRKFRSLWKKGGGIGLFGGRSEKNLPQNISSLGYFCVPLLLALWPKLHPKSGHIPLSFVPWI